MIDMLVGICTSSEISTNNKNNCSTEHTFGQKGQENEQVY